MWHEPTDPFQNFIGHFVPHALYWACDCISMLGLKLNYVSKRCPWKQISMKFGLWYNFRSREGNAFNMTCLKCVICEVLIFFFLFDSLRRLLNILVAGLFQRPQRSCDFTVINIIASSAVFRVSDSISLVPRVCGRIKLELKRWMSLYDRFSYCGSICAFLYCYLKFMMTSSNGNIFRVTGHLCREFTGPRWIPHTKASDAQLWCFLWSASE